MSPENRPQKPIAVYVRVSRVNGREVEAEGGTAAEQERRCRAQAAADGYAVGEVFTDLDESGGKASRPAFDRMMQSIADGEHGGVIVWNLRRFGRSTRNVLDGVEAIERAGGAFVSCSEKIDTTTPMGRFALTIFAALGQMELEERAEGWRSARVNAHARGLYLARAPYGYVKEAGRLAIDPEAAEHVRTAFAMRARGRSLRAIAAMLNEQGSTRAGNPWRGEHIRRMMSNEAYLGHTVTADVGAEHDTHPAIIDRATFHAVQGRGRIDGAPTVGRPVATYALTGIVRCGSCGGRMSHDYQQKNGKAYGKYRCKNAGCDAPVTVSGPAIEAHVLTLAAARAPETIEGTVRVGADPAAIDAARVAVEEIEQRINETRAALTSGTVSPTLAVEVLGEMESALAEAQENLAALLEVEEITAEVKHEARAGILRLAEHAANGGGWSQPADGERIRIEHKPDGEPYPVATTAYVNAQARRYIRTVTIARGRGSIADRITDVEYVPEEETGEER